MNSLSWLLYAADVSDTIKTSAPFFAGLGIIVSGVAYPASFMVGETYSYQSPEEKAAAQARPAQVQKFARSLALWSVAALLLVAVLPTRSTLMLIAASEVGETVLASEQAQQIGGEAGALATDSLRVLRKFINEQLAEGEK